MTALRIRVAALVGIIIAGSPAACGPPTPVHRYTPDNDRGEASPDAGSARGGATGGDETGVTGSDDAGSGRGGSGATGGRPPIAGRGGDGQTGGSAGDGGSGGTPVAGTGGSEMDAAVSSGGTGGAGGGNIDASPPAMDAPGKDGNGGTGGGTPDAGGPVLGNNGTALCYPDPAVIAICKQLEPACENCPDKSIWNQCFAMAAAGDDKACARYAVQNNCKVDQGGNTCGSLNCAAKGCNRTACMTAQGNGDTTKCAPLLTSCPCQ
jgi:hypothetical protein